MIYIFLRFILIPVAFVGWILFQLLVKKKRFADLQNELLTITAFLAIWALLVWMVRL